MPVLSNELRRCEALLVCTADSLEATSGLGSALHRWPAETVGSLAAMLEQDIAQLAPMIRPVPDPPLTERLWELAEIEDGFETALAFHGWRLDEPLDELPPVLTDRLDDQA
jgi:hypothetical protein